MSDDIVPAVKAIIEKEGRILALRAELESTYWILPGGRVEYGESAEKALKREIQEELSCSSEVREALGVFHFFKGEQNEGKQVVVTVFKAEIGEQEIDVTSNPAEDYITDYRWLKPEELVEKIENHKPLKQWIEKQYKL